MTSKKRSGPQQDQFSAPLNWYVIPQRDHLDSKIVLLTTRYTMSGAETFALALKTSDRVIQVGDTTGGAFSDNISREMYNGWIYTISVGNYRDSNGKSLEGVGIAPDVVIRNSPEEIKQGKDRALEYAVHYLEQ